MWSCIITAIQQSVERENFARLCAVASFASNLIVCECGNPHFANGCVSPNATYKCTECVGFSNGDADVPTAKKKAKPFSKDVLPKYLRDIVEDNERDPLDVAEFVLARSTKEATQRRYVRRKSIAAMPLTSVEREQLRNDAAWCAAPDDYKGFLRAFERLLSRAKRKKFAERDELERGDKLERRERLRAVFWRNRFSNKKGIWTPPRDQCFSRDELKGQFVTTLRKVPLHSVVALHRDVLDALLNPERDTDDAATAFVPCWRNRLELEMLRDVWQRIEEAIASKRSETVTRALREVLVADAGHNLYPDTLNPLEKIVADFFRATDVYYGASHIKRIAAKYNLDAATLQRHVNRVLALADIYDVLRKSFVLSKMSERDIYEEEGAA